MLIVAYKDADLADGFPCALKPVWMCLPQKILYLRSEELLILTLTQLRFDFADFSLMQPPPQPV